MKHTYDTDIAAKVGVVPAAMFDNILFWIIHNKSNKKHFYEGNYWTYNSIAAFHEIFYYLTKRQIEHSIKKLIESGLIKTGNFNPTAYNRTLWYSIPNLDKYLQKMDYAINNDVESIQQLCKIHLTNLLNDNTDNKPYINTDINIHTNIAKHDLQIFIQKNYSNVSKLKRQLTFEECEKLLTNIPKQTLIDLLNEMENKADLSKKYQSVYLTLNNWYKRNEQTKRTKPNYNSNAGTKSSYNDRLNLNIAELHERNRQILEQQAVDFATGRDSDFTEFQEI